MPSPSHRSAGKQDQLLSCIVARGMQVPCKCLGQDLEGSEPPYPVWVWSLTWPDPTAACRVMGRAGLALCRCSCAHPVHGLHTLTCCSRPGRETSSAHRARSAAVPSVPAAQQQPGHRAGRHPQLPSRLATAQVPPGAGQGSGDIPLLVGSQAGVSQASCPALGTVPWLCLTRLCPAPHSSPFSSGTWGWQCHVQAALPPRDRARGCLPGTRPHLPARAPSPTFNPCYAAAHHHAALAEQAGKAGCVFIPLLCPPHPAFHSSHGAESAVTGWGSPLPDAGHCQGCTRVWATIRRDTAQPWHGSPGAKCGTNSPLFCLRHQ